MAEAKGRAASCTSTAAQSRGRAARAAATESCRRSPPATARPGTPGGSEARSSSSSALRAASSEGGKTRTRPATRGTRARVRAEAQYRGRPPSGRNCLGEARPRRGHAAAAARGQDHRPCVHCRPSWCCVRAFTFFRECRGSPLRTGPWHETCAGRFHATAIRDCAFCRVTRRARLSPPRLAPRPNAAAGFPSSAARWVRHAGQDPFPNFRDALKKRESDCKPGSVEGCHSSRIRLPRTSSSLPEGIGRASLKRLPIWPFSGRGLPSRRRHRRRWWALAPPFHPYRRGVRAGGLFSVALSGGRPPGRYPASRPAEPGLSSPAHAPRRQPVRLPMGT